MAAQETASGGKVRTGIILVAVGILCVIALYVSVYVGAAHLRATGQQRGEAPQVMPLMLAGLVFVGSGIHRILWVPPRGEALSHGVKQIISAGIAMGSLMALSFVAGMVAAVLRASGV
ncbi:MAG: hypothetical protein QM765_14815 [Myxococcales bacterium]